jgi:DNA topoisomerase-3
VIPQREIPKEQIQKLIATGKTDLLPKSTSKKGRPFSAHLKLDKSKVGFEFAEKVPKRPRHAKQLPSNVPDLGHLR